MLNAIRSRFQVGVGRGLHAVRYYNWGAKPGYAGPISRRARDYLNAYYNSRAILNDSFVHKMTGLRIHCNLREWLVRDYLSGQGPIYEWDEISYARTKIRSGDRIVDVGANYGFWGFLVASGTPGVRLDLVEPNPDLAEFIRRTVADNRMALAKVHQAAMSDVAGATIPFYLPPINTTGAGSTVLHDYALENKLLAANNHIEVTTTTLDLVADSEQGRRIDLLKIDVEFAEDAVLRGASKLFQGGGPRFIMCETSAKSFAFEFLVGKGYNATVFKGSGNLVPIVKGEEFWGNIFFEAD